MCFGMKDLMNLIREFSFQWPLSRGEEAFTSEHRQIIMPFLSRSSSQNHMPSDAVAAELTHLSTPILVVQIPAHRGHQPHVKAVAWLPAQLAAHPGGWREPLRAKGGRAPGRSPPPPACWCAHHGRRRRASTWSSA